MKKIHFIGIGGIGISALAQMLKNDDTQVTGSDRDASPVTELLEQKEIEVIIPQKAENVPADADIVVYSDAVPEDNPERVCAEEKGIPQFSYFQMLGKISEGKRTIAVAGTHGKTTTTGMLAKILIDAGASPTAIIGSIVKDFGSNFLQGDSDLFVIEACEYRDHLLELSPQILVITNLEWDHTDYFPSLEALQETFRKAILHVPADGAIVTDPSNKNIMPILGAARARVIDYTQEPAYELRLFGAFNVSNARAAAAAARVAVQHHVLMHDSQHLVLNSEQIATSLVAFQGTWRRFEYKGKTAKGADVYDDYAHHPTAIRETLCALREKTDGRVFVAFHPHLYSRTRDLLDEFATAFGDADKIFIAPIFAAREKDDGTISSEMFAERIRKNGGQATAATFGEIESALQHEPNAGDVIMTMGAGDIYKVADRMVEQNKKPAP